MSNVICILDCSFVVFNGLLAVSVNTLRRHLRSVLVLVNIHHTAFTEVNVVEVNPS